MPTFLLILDSIICSVVFQKFKREKNIRYIFKKCLLLCGSVNFIGVVIGFLMEEMEEKDFLYNFGYVMGYIAGAFIISLSVGMLIGFGINSLIFYRKLKRNEKTIDTKQ